METLKEDGGIQMREQTVEYVGRRIVVSRSPRRMSILQVPYLADLAACHWSHAYVRIGSPKFIGRYDGMRYLKPVNDFHWSLNMQAGGSSC